METPLEGNVTYRWVVGIMFTLLLSAGGFLTTVLVRDSGGQNEALRHRLLQAEEQIRVNTGRLNAQSERLVVLEWYQKQTDKRLEELERRMQVRDGR